MSILVVDDEPNIRRMLIDAMTIEGHRVIGAATVHDALLEGTRGSFDVALVDLRIGVHSGLDLIPRLIADSPWLKVIVITAYASIESAVEAMKRGAVNYLTKPFTPAQVRQVLEQAAELRAMEYGAEEPEISEGESDRFAVFDSRAPKMAQALEVARQAALSDATVLICGAPGTGKRILARAIHGWSKRAQRPFTTISCRNLSPELLESGLFGSIKGAFPGTVQDSIGRVAAAEGGTVFFDEIGDLPLALQPKLLRLIQEREYERIGDPATRKADVRFIAATSLDLESAVKTGQFRVDLLYRINVIDIVLPSLRERRDDVLPLASQMLAQLSCQHRVSGFTDEAKQALEQYDWPGNVRELRSVIERAAKLCDSDRIGAQLIPDNFPNPTTEPRLGDPVPVEQIEEMHIRRVLASSNSLGNAARTLGMDSATLWRKRKKFGI